ncbi:MAG: hypothetical protein R3A44_10400 [Caldilineaceae bacterium]
MEISLFQDDEPLRFERIIFYPYPDLKRIWARLWLTAQQDRHPNLDIRVLNPDGSENNSVSMLAQSDQRLEKTLHMRNPQPGATYRVIAELTLGLNQAPELLDRQEFDMVLEFRNPDAKEPGFGMGVDWTAFQSDSTQI